MAKRFTDTDKYKKTFMRSLPGPYKLFWDYLYHECNHAGIWHVDFEVAQIYVGKDMPINETEALRLFNAGEIRITVLGTGQKWFIRPFVPFQYGPLNDANRLHKSVLSFLDKEGLSKGLISPFQGAKDKDKDKDKVGVGVGDGVEGVRTRPVVFDFDAIWATYPKRIGRKEAERHFRASVKSDVDFKNIQLAIRNYVNSKQVKDGFIQNGSTWFNNWQDWINYTGEHHGANVGTGLFDSTNQKSGTNGHRDYSPGLRKASVTAGAVLDGIRDRQLSHADRREEPKEPSRTHQPERH